MIRQALLRDRSCWRSFSPSPSTSRSGRWVLPPISSPCSSSRGTLAATLIAYPLARLSWTARLIMKSFTVREEMTSTIEGIVRLAHIYRRRGIRS